MTPDILVVDDERDIRDLVAGILEDEGYTTRTAGDSDEALLAIRSGKPSLIFLDIWLQGSPLDGLRLLDMIKEEYAELPVVMISGHGNIETAISAIKRGAYDYVEKPFKADRLIFLAERSLEIAQLRKKVREFEDRSPFVPELIGCSQAITTLRQMIKKIAPTNSRIMIFGASGVGKELVARMIHQHSDRLNQPFIVLNAASITPDGMEVALFGTEMGDERGRIVGALEEAHGGTLYIGEIADMPIDTQSKILRVLVDQQFVRVGGGTKMKVDVRILSSTACNLETAIAKGRFREDLFYRLSVVPVRVPPLSERLEDIPLLVAWFVEEISKQTGLKHRYIADDAMAILQTRPWPGNVRQLKNNIERILILAQADTNSAITAKQLPSEVGEMLPSITNDGFESTISLPLREARELFERHYISAQLGRFGGNISKTAEFIGMERSALHRKIKLLNRPTSP